MNRLDPIGEISPPTSDDSLLHMPWAETLRPRTAAVLEYLYRRRGRTVGRRELLDGVWGTTVVCDDSLVQCVSEIRRALPAGAGYAIRTFPRRGYRLSVGDERSARAGSPAIEVQPFGAVPAGRGSAFAQALSSDILTELWRHKEFRVIAGRGAGEPVGAGMVAGIVETLTPTYRLGGHVQLRAHRVRVNVRLLDLRDGSVVWSRRYEGESSALLELQDTITMSVVNRLGGGAGAVVANERARMTARPNGSETAYEHYLLGADVDEYFTADGSRAAIGHLDRVVAEDRLFAKSWSRLAILHLVRLAFDYTDAPEETAEAFVTAALTAVEVDPGDPLAHAAAGGAHYLRGEPELGRVSFDRALERGAGNADVLATVAYIRPSKLPTAAEDLANVRRAMSLNVNYPYWYSLAFGYSAYYAGHCREAIAELARVRDSVIDKHLYLVLCHAELGGAEGALGPHRRRLLEMQPDFSTEAIITGDAITDEAALARFRRSAARAGLPP